MNKNSELFYKYLDEEGLAIREKLREILNRPDITKGMTTGVSKRYKKGDIIYNENLPTERLYYIKEGRVFLKSFDADGNEFIYNVVPKNDFFGMSSIINAYAMSSALAAADSEIYSVEAKQFDELLIKNPELCLTALKYIVKRYRNNEIRLKNISGRNSKKLFSNYIISIMGEKGKLLENNTILISNQLTNEEMASMLGISRETLSRLFNQAKREEIIDYNRKEIIIINLEALVNF